MLPARLLDILVPPVCLACGAAGADGLCGPCRAVLPWLHDACPRCALPRPCGRRGPRGRGARCPASRAPFRASWAPVAFAGPARELVHALKFRSALTAADVMAAQIAARLPFRDPGRVLVPVPPARTRARTRGFDPADRLARALARRTGLTLVRSLERTDSGRQVGADRHGRRGVRIEARRSTRAPERLILVDDVHTTGATLAASAQALRAAGARDVVAVTYARTLA